MYPRHMSTHGKRALSSAILSASMAGATLTAGCASTDLPCMQYQPQMVTRFVSMRGHGAVQVTEEALVCTHRAGSMEEGAIGP